MPQRDSKEEQVPTASQVIEFGSYLLLEQIAVGGMAEVFLGKKRVGDQFGNLIAIKRILPELVQDEAFITMFVDEARIAGQLHHPAIVPVFEVGKIGDHHYMTMEYVWGKDLLRIVKRALKLGTTLAPAMVAWIAAQVCGALHYAHERRDREGRSLGIIHRDVSPHNILVSYDGHARLCDFGIAKATTRRTVTQVGVIKGKLGYLSPELARGQIADRRSDIFALGTCMYESLVGARLFAHPNNRIALERVREGRVYPLSDVAPHLPAELSAIVMRALASRPEARFQTAEEMRHELLRFLAQMAPSYERVTLANWLRHAFEAEFTREKRHLDALDCFGRSDPSSFFHESAVTRLEIVAPDLESTQIDPKAIARLEQAEREVFAKADEPSEIFFRASDPSHAAGSSGRHDALRPGTPVISATESDHAVLAPDTIPGIAPDFEPTHPEWRANLTPIVPDDPNSGEKPLARISAEVRPPPDHRARTKKERRRDAAGSWQFGVVALGVIVAGVAAVISVMDGSTGRLEVRATPPTQGAIIIDGRPQGSLPFASDEIPAGDRTIVITAPGFAPTERTIHIPAGGTTILEVALQPGDTPSVH